MNPNQPGNSESTVCPGLPTPYLSLSRGLSTKLLPSYHGVAVLSMSRQYSTGLWLYYNYMDLFKILTKSTYNLSNELRNQPSQEYFWFAQIKKIIHFLWSKNSVSFQQIPPSSHTAIHKIIPKGRELVLCHTGCGTKIEPPHYGGGSCTYFLSWISWYIPYAYRTLLSMINQLGLSSNLIPKLNMK